MPLTPQRWTHLPKRKGEEGRAAPLELQGESLPRKEEQPTQGDTDRRKAWGGPGAGTGARKGEGETLNSSYSGALSAACSVPGV